MHKLNPRTAALLSAFGWAVGYLLAGKVLAVLLPDRAYSWLMRYERYGMALLMLLLLTGVLDVPLEFLRDGLLNGLEAIGTWPVQLLLALR